MFLCLNTVWRFLTVVMGGLKVYFFDSINISSDLEQMYFHDFFFEKLKVQKSCRQLEKGRECLIENIVDLQNYKKKLLFKKTF